MNWEFCLDNYVLSCLVYSKLHFNFHLTKFLSYLGWILFHSMSLRERSFSNFQFYRQNENSLTPAGLSFFQSQWDKTITSVFHDVLGM